MNKILEPLNSLRARSTKREPLYEYKELPDQFNVLPGQFHRAATRAIVPFPKPRLEQNRRKWYALSEVRAWWEAVGGAEFACSEHAERNKVYRERYKAKRAESQS